MSAAMSPAYPFGLDVDPPAKQNRLTILFRIILAIPHLLIVNILANLIQILVFFAWVVIIVTGKLPSSFASLILGVFHWEMRVYGYVYLLAGRYPPFAFGEDTSYPVRLWGQPELEGRNRLSVFFRIILAIPHIILILILAVIAAVLLLIGWIVGIFTGQLPGGIHNFLAGFSRWYARVTAYLYLLTDRYPPFSLS
jgi:hypothetical protein